MAKQPIKKKKHKQNKKIIKTGCINIGGSLYSQKGEKMTEVKKVLLDEDPDILFLQETELQNVDVKSPPIFENYKTHCPKKNRAKNKDTMPNKGRFSPQSQNGSRDRKL